MSGAEPRIAVVIPNFNDGPLLREAVASVSEPEPVEVVVVDDGSDDAETLAILEELERSGANVVRQANAGVSRARMTGVTRTSARYVFPLDSDDRLCAGALARMADALDARPNAGFAYGDYVLFGSYRGRYVAPEQLHLWTMTYVNLVPVSSLIRRTALLEAGGWTLEQGHEDWDLWLTLLDRGWTGAPVEGVVYERRVHAGRRFAGARSRHREECLRIRSRHESLYRRRRELRRSERVPWPWALYVMTLFGLVRNRDLLPYRLELLLLRTSQALALRRRGER